MSEGAWRLSETALQTDRAMMRVALRAPSSQRCTMRNGFSAVCARVASSGATVCEGEDHANAPFITMDLPVPQPLIQGSSWVRKIDAQAEVDEAGHSRTLGELLHEQGTDPRPAMAFHDGHPQTASFWTNGPPGVVRWGRLQA